MSLRRHAFWRESPDEEGAGFCGHCAMLVQTIKLIAQPKDCRVLATTAYCDSSCAEDNNVQTSFITSSPSDTSATINGRCRATRANRGHGRPHVHTRAKSTKSSLPAKVSRSSPGSDQFSAEQNSIDSDFCSSQLQSFASGDDMAPMQAGLWHAVACRQWQWHASKTSPGHASKTLASGQWSSGRMYTPFCGEVFDIF